MKILITGIAGFIGYHVAKHLMNKNNMIVGIDSINDYYDVALKYDRLCDIGIEHPSEGYAVISNYDPNLLFQKMDLNDQDKMASLFTEHQFDVVIHLAAQAGVRYSIEKPFSYISSNIIGFMNILEGCRHNKVKHLIYASSSSVYGAKADVPFNEDDRVDSPISLYAATKKSNELFAYTYSHLYGLPTTGLRFFTVYGPWGRPDMAPFLFTNAILHNQPIKVFNYGNMMRDFTYIDDIVKGVIDLMPQGPEQKERRPCYQIFNIGNSKPVQLRQFISILEAKIGKKAQLEMYPMQPGDVEITYANTEKLESFIGYTPNTSLEAGITHLISWYKQYYSLC